ncbi:stressosome-associated protein Prli42 [Fictibacillus sp. NRS-1165]
MRRLKSLYNNKWIRRVMMSQKLIKTVVFIMLGSLLLTTLLTGISALF